MNEKTITSQIEKVIFELLEQSPDGLRWIDLAKAVKGGNPEFHPKTVNGLIWKLAQKYPDKVYKPTKGVFRLTKFR